MNKRLFIPNYATLSCDIHESANTKLLGAVCGDYWEMLPAINTMFEYVMTQGALTAKTVQIDQLISYARNITVYAKELDPEGRIFSELTLHHTPDSFAEYLNSPETDLTLRSIDVAIMRSAGTFDGTKDTTLSEDQLADMSESTVYPDKFDVLSEDRCPKFRDLVEKRIKLLLNAPAHRERFSPQDTLQGTHKVDEFKETDFDWTHYIARHFLPIMMVTERPDARFLSVYQAVQIMQVAEDVLAMSVTDRDFWSQVNVLRCALYASI